MNNAKGEIINGLVAASIFLLLLAVIIIFLIMQYKKKQYENRRSLDELQSQFQNELLRTQLEIQEQTLKTISQEIHDNIGQVLSLAKLNLNTMDISRMEQLQEKIGTSKQLVSKAIQDLRDLSKSMNTDNINSLGLLRSIEYELDMIRKTGYETQFDITGDKIKMQPQKELIVFRIIQETLNNIIKHADAKKIIITAAYKPDSLELSIEDNGKGMDLQPLNNEVNSDFGLGIRNMHNRAKLIGADFNMQSSIGKGTVVRIIIPFTTE